MVNNKSNDQGIFKNLEWFVSKAFGNEREEHGSGLGGLHLHNFKQGNYLGFGTI